MHALRPAWGVSPHKLLMPLLRIGHAFSEQCTLLLWPTSKVLTTLFFSARLTSIQAEAESLSCEAPSICKSTAIAQLTWTTTQRVNMAFALWDVRQSPSRRAKPCTRGETGPVLGKRCLAKVKNYKGIGSPRWLPCRPAFPPVGTFPKQNRPSFPRRGHFMHHRSSSNVITG